MEGLAGSLRGLGTGRQPSLWERLPEVRVPTLLVVGEEDGKFTRVAYEMTKRLPEARVVVVPGAGHTVHLENPAGFAAALEEFLNSAESKPFGNPIP